MAVFHLLKCNWWIPESFLVNASTKGNHLFSFLTWLLWTFNWNCPPNVKVILFLLKKKTVCFVQWIKNTICQNKFMNVHLSGLVCKIWTTRSNDQNSPFHPGKNKILIFQKPNCQLSSFSLFAFRCSLRSWWIS